MYKGFFGLSECPFSVSPDPRYLFWTKRTQESVAALAYSVHRRKGFILLTGEVGTGKTTLLNSLLEWLRNQKIPSAFVSNCKLSHALHLLDFILADFGIACESREKSKILLALRQWLLEQYRRGKTAVLIIDEAQNLPDDLLEEVRLLTNLETPSGKLLQIVLAGQPELDVRMQQPQLRQLRQRIVFHCQTAALTLEETGGYINARLRIAGANEAPVFSTGAVEAIYYYSHGIPRVINLLCEHALINSFAEEIRPVCARTVEDIARELQLDKIPPIAPAAWLDQTAEPSDRIEGLIRNGFTILRPAERPSSWQTTTEKRKHEQGL